MYDNGTTETLKSRDGIYVYNLFPHPMISYSVIMFIDIAPLFFIIVGITWWMRRMKKLQGGDRPKVQSKKGDFTCSDCGGDVFDSEASCPHCGASFDDE